MIPRLVRRCNWGVSGGLYGMGRIDHPVRHCYSVVLLALQTTILQAPISTFTVPTSTFKAPPTPTTIPTTIFHCSPQRTIFIAFAASFRSVYLSMSFSFASYPCTSFTPAFADGAVEIYRSSLALSFLIASPCMAESQPQHDTTTPQDPFPLCLLRLLAYDFLSVGSSSRSTAPFA